MAKPATVIACVTVAAAVSAACGWFGDERTAIRSRLRDFTIDVNATAPEGLGTVARAAGIASFFTDDVIVDLGEGTAPIAGRETLVAMAARLQPRLAEFTLDFTDENIRVSADGQSADVTLTVEFIRRDPAARQQMDAREFRLQMRHDGQEWKIARATAVDTLK
jgi:ketosteroid isomerase-like protein